MSSSQDTLDTYEHTRFLAMSSARIHLLRHLDETPQSPRDLADALSLSRRGIQRNLSELVERGWSEKVDGTYRLTTNGTLITKRYMDFRTTLGIIDDCEPFFEHLPDCDHVPSPEWLHDAELLVATSDQPSAPIRQYVNGLRTEATTGSATTIRSVLPFLSQYHAEIHAELTECGVKTELVSHALETTRKHRLQPFESVRCDALSLYEHLETVEFGLTLSDRCGYMSAHDELGRIRACIECDDPAFLDWATKLYRRYRNNARAIDSGEILAGRHK